MIEDKKTIEQIAAEDGRFDVRAIQFVFEGLSRTVEQYERDRCGDTESRHITGAQLAMGLAELALERWGPTRPHGAGKMGSKIDP